jgi:hypothetical protein
MGVLNGDSGIRKATEGIRVDRAAATLPQTTAEALFTVSGGRVVINQILGEVTTIIETQANNTKLVGNPTTGTSADLCAVLNISADEVGTLYGITGTFSDAMLGTNAGGVPAQSTGVIVNEGTIDLNCAASNTGAIKWTVLYTPIDDGASVVAA